MERERVMEMFAGGIFVALLLILVLIVVSSGAESDSKTTVISNSFNIYSTSYEDKNYKTGPYQYRHSNYNGDYYDGRYRNMDYYDAGRRYYSKGVFGNDISTYSVYVKNLEPSGGYFTVKFRFKDDYGRTRTESVTKYIGSYDEERFFHRNIYDDGYGRWGYDVVSESSVPKRHY